MKFITEENLRDLYKMQPFTDYDLQKGERLTPSARQFLIDRGIYMYDRNDPLSETAQEQKIENKVEAETTVEIPKGRQKQLLEGKFKSLKAKFLLTARTVMNLDVCLSQQLIMLYRQFAALSEASRGGFEAVEFCGKTCNGINGENASCRIGDCFEITDFHMQMPKGKELLLMARLRSDIEVFEVETEILMEDKDLQNSISEKLYQIINTLSQMICTAMGGNECQRKS